MRACARSRPTSRPNSPPKSSGSSSVSASSRKSAKTTWTDELTTEAAQLEERRGEIDETIDGLAVYSDKDRARAGCIVTIGDDGEFCLHQGLVERTAVRGAVDTDEADAQTDDDGDEPFTPVSDDEDDDPSPRPSSTGAEQALRKECGFSQLLVDDLKAHRLQITRAHLAADFEVAFDLALYSLCIDLFDRFRYHSHPLDLRATETRAAQLAQRSLRHPGRPADRGARQRARSRLAEAAAGRRLRRARGTADARPSSVSSPGASPPA